MVTTSLSVGILSHIVVWMDTQGWWFIYGVLITIVHSPCIVPFLKLLKPIVTREEKTFWWLNIMLQHRGIDRGSIIVGSSVHNQRVERIWRDMHRCVTVIYYRLFYFMESQGYLNPISEKDLFALHYVFLPRIQRSLTLFREGWNNHGIRTEHNKTPNQLFASGALQL